jgi:hypothetical protein
VWHIWRLEIRSVGVDVVETNKLTISDGTDYSDVAAAQRCRDRSLLIDNSRRMFWLEVVQTQRSSPRVEVD